MNTCAERVTKSEVILVSCSGMCVHGQVSARAVHRVLYETAPGKCNWVCPAAIPAGIHWQKQRLQNARAIIAVPGCPAKCDVKLLKAAGFTPTAIVEAYKVCDFSPWGMELTDIPASDQKNLVDRVAEAIEQKVEAAHAPTLTKSE